MEQCILGLPLHERAAIEAVFLLLAENGVKAPGVPCRQIEGKLWEIEAGPHRIFYVVIVGSEMVLLHAYRKQSRKAPSREVDGPVKG